MKLLTALLAVALASSTCQDCPPKEINSDVKAMLTTETKSCDICNLEMIHYHGTANGMPMFGPDDWVGVRCEELSVGFDSSFVSGGNMYDGVEVMEGNVGIMAVGQINSEIETEN